MLQMVQLLTAYRDDWRYEATARPRTDDWTTADENPISFDEWTNHARADATLVKAGVISLRDTELPEQPVFALAHGTSLHWWLGGIVATLADDIAVGYRKSSRHFIAATASLRGTKIL
jgi:hypothetical protein